MTTLCWTERTQPALGVEPPDDRQWINWIPIMICVTVFTIDVVTPRGLLACALYVLAPAACLWVPHAVLSSRLALVTTGLILINFWMDSDVGVPLWVSIANISIAVALVWAVTWMVGLRNRHAAETAMLLSRIRALRDRMQATEVVVCRKVSLHLHESVGQELSAIGWGLDEMQRNPHDAQDIRTSAVRLRGILGRCLESTRLLVADLHSRSVDRYSVERQVRVFVGEFSGQTRIPVRLHGEELLSTLNDEGANAVFHAIREALFNVGKHARATRASIEFRTVGSSLEIAITDDGIGIDTSARPKAASVGLLGVKEQLRAVGGSLQIGRHWPKGTCLEIELPLDGPTA
jgi:signal transduction histidine kinase